MATVFRPWVKLSEEAIAAMKAVVQLTERTHLDEAWRANDLDYLKNIIQLETSTLSRPDEVKEFVFECDRETKTWYAQFDEGVMKSVHPVLWLTTWLRKRPSQVVTLIAFHTARDMTIPVYVRSLDPGHTRVSARFNTGKRAREVVRRTPRVRQVRIARQAHAALRNVTGKKIQKLSRTG